MRGNGFRIRQLLSSHNVAEDPQRRFEIDPAVLLRCHRLARRPSGLDILGYYHSHPGGSPVPSRTDADMAQPDGKLWLIVTRTEARMWRAVAQGSMYQRFDPVAFDMVAGKRVITTPAAVLRPGDAQCWSAELEYFRD